MTTLQLRLLSLAFFAILCATLTYWVVTLTARGSDSANAVAAARTPVSMDDAAALFGGQKGPRDADIRLSGILSLGQRGSAAIISVNGEPGRAISVGQQLGSNGTLSEVRPRSVLIEHNGSKSEIFLPTTITGPAIYMR